MPTNNEGPGAAPAPRHEVEGPRITDALYEPFRNQPAPMGFDPADGLPRPIVSQVWQDAQAPSLDPTRFVCMVDCSAFVVRGSWGDPIARFEPAEVERAPDGRWRVTREALVSKVLLSNVSLSEGVPVIDGYVEVEPLRPQCRHYARQLVPFPEERDRTLAVRLCTARRSDEGEFLDLGNQQVLACELRSPRYGNEASQIDAFDARTIASQHAAKAAEVADDFDLDAALGESSDSTTKGN